MLNDGASFIDVGAYSSRPGAADVSPKEELKRAIHAITLVINKFPNAVISVDTFRSEVAHAAIQEGAAMVNDISSGNLDANMLETVAGLNVPYIAMHMRGTPRTMNDQTEYQNLLIDITNHLQDKIRTFREAGIKDIIIDPGFGFSKTIEQNYVLLNNLEYLKILGQPIMVGVSRKSLIWKTLATTPDLALNGTTVLNTIAILKGANIVRVHDVKPAMEVIKLVTTTLA
jgi:dihydropteroate synthase